MENKNENTKYQKMGKMNCGCHGRSMDHGNHDGYSHGGHDHGCRHGEGGRGMGTDSVHDLESYKEKLEQEILQLQEKIDNLREKDQENHE